MPWASSVFFSSSSVSSLFFSVPFSIQHPFLLLIAIVSLFPVFLECLLPSLSQAWPVHTLKPTNSHPIQAAWGILEARGTLSLRVKGEQNRQEIYFAYFWREMISCIQLSNLALPFEENSITIDTKCTVPLPLHNFHICSFSAHHPCMYKPCKVLSRT